MVIMLALQKQAHAQIFHTAAKFDIFSFIFLQFLLNI